MAGPWEKYSGAKPTQPASPGATSDAEPWAKYNALPTQGEETSTGAALWSGLLHGLGNIGTGAARGRGGRWRRRGGCDRLGCPPLVPWRSPRLPGRGGPGSRGKDLARCGAYAGQPGCPPLAGAGTQYRVQGAQPARMADPAQF